jgi:uncharacterized membrane protein YraQ (UPF0718 family)
VTGLLVAFGLELWQLLCEMGPWLLLGFAVAGLLSVLIDPETIERHLGGRGLVPVLKAAGVGVPLPLCSCGVIPVAASLRQHGASRGATAAFLIATPQTGVDSIAVTYSLLGPLMAVVRPLAALFSGIVGGLVVDGVEGRHDRPAARFAGLAALPGFGAPGADPAAAPARRWTGRLGDALHYGFVTLPRDLAGPMLWGLLAAAAIGLALPDDFFAGTLGAGLPGMLAMMLIGIPVYVCASASVPVAAALIAKGLSPGAALVFLMTGPATNTATLAAVWKLMGRRTAVLYLLSIALTALAAGLLLNALAGGEIAHEAAHHHEFLPGWLETGSAIAVALLLLAALAPPRWTAMIQRSDSRKGDPA